MSRALSRRKFRDTSRKISATMRTSSLNSPIQSLDFDLLWYIISLNADMFNNERALETTLATSRVCRGWRTSMLSVPSLWAHLIDLDHLRWCTVGLRREIVRRSGTMLLWVKARRCVGHHLDHPAHHMTFVMDTLDEIWDQIHRLDANILIEYVGFHQWAPLCRPAPHLALLNLTFIEHTFLYMERPVLYLLGGAAPMVRGLYEVAIRSNLQLHALIASHLGAQRCVDDRRSSRNPCYD